MSTSRDKYAHYEKRIIETANSTLLLAEHYMAKGKIKKRTVQTDIVRLEKLLSSDRPTIGQIRSYTDDLLDNIVFHKEIKC